MEKTSARTEKWENAFSGKQLDSVPEETPVVFTTDLILVNEHSHPLVLQERRRRQTEESLANMANLRGESPSGLKGRKICENVLGGACTETSCDFWHPSVCLNHKSESGKSMVLSKSFYTLMLVGSPVKSQRKVAQKDRWLY